MATVAQDAGLTPGVAISLPPAIRLPAASTVGATGVSSGFPHSPEGAAAQLAAAVSGPLLFPSPRLAAELGRLDPERVHVVLVEGDYGY